MATNSQNTYPITANTVPSDRQCIRDGSDIVALVQDFCQVQGLGGNSGSSFPSQDTIGQQALQLAQQLQAQIAVLIGQILTFRIGQTYAQIPPSATTEIPIQWDDAMPNTNYIVIVGIVGNASNTGVTANFAYWAVKASLGLNECSIHFDNAPAQAEGFQFNWLVIAAPNAASAGTTVVTGFSPASGPVGTVLTVNGIGLTSLQSVTICGVTAAWTAGTDNAFTVTVPVGATGTGAITVTTGLGVSTAPNPFTVT